MSAHRVAPDGSAAQPTSPDEEGPLAFVRRGSMLLAEGFSANLIQHHAENDSVEQGVVVELREKIRDLEAKVDTQDQRLREVELVSGLADVESGGGDDDTDQLLEKPAGLLKRPTVLKKLETARPSGDVNVLEHEVKSSCVALTVAAPSIVLALGAQLASELILDVWEEEMTLRCIICYTFTTIAFMIFTNERAKWEWFFSKYAPATGFAMFAFTAAFELHPGQWGWVVVLVGAWFGYLVSYKHYEEKEYPPLLRYMLVNCTLHALIPGGVVFAPIYALMWAVTSIKRELIQVSITACVYPALCLLAKKVILASFCNEEFVAKKGAQGVGAFAASFEISLNFIGTMVLFSKIESISIGFLSAGLYMFTEVVGKGLILYAMESVHARNALIMSREEALEKLHAAKHVVAHRWAYEMMGEKMLLVVAPIICKVGNTSVLTVEEMATIAGIFFVFEILTDMTQCYILETQFSVPITQVSVRPSFNTSILWAGSIVAMAQCVQMGTSTFANVVVAVRGGGNATTV